MDNRKNRVQTPSMKQAALGVTAGKRHWHLATSPQTDAIRVNLAGKKGCKYEAAFGLGHGADGGAGSCVAGIRYGRGQVASGPHTETGLSDVLGRTRDSARGGCGPQRRGGY